ncbi:MAG TPA: molecular chaperone HtpG, partial [Acetobacteraceae bacterium]|nr:molecular chaperone HtpG [Acetobacteraceae bacterium]
EEAGLLPPWLRFVQGVVDTEDLPLNVSREMLQATPVLARIRKAVTNRVLGELKNRAGNAEDYEKFWTQFGPVLKEGVWDDAEHRKELAGLMRFRSSSQEGWTGLADYAGRMKEGQEAIYVLTGDDAESLAKSPQLEGFRARGIEVLLLTDPVDSFWPERLHDWEGKPIRSVTQGAADLSKLKPEAEPEGEAADVEKLLPALKAALGEAVAEVRATDRLVESAVVLATAGFGPDLQMQRLLRRHGRGGLNLPPTLELNPRHKLIRGLAARADAGEDVSEAAHTLLDLARVQDGDMPTDPAAFARRVTEALSR